MDFVKEIYFGQTNELHEEVEPFHSGSNGFSSLSFSSGRQEDRKTQRKTIGRREFGR